MVLRGGSLPRLARTAQPGREIRNDARRPDEAFAPAGVAHHRRTPARAPGLIGRADPGAGRPPRSPSTRPSTPGHALTSLPRVLRRSAAGRARCLSRCRGCLCRGCLCRCLCGPINRTRIPRWPRRPRRSAGPLVVERLRVVRIRLTVFVQTQGAIGPCVDAQDDPRHDHEDDTDQQSPGDGGENRHEKDRNNEQPAEGVDSTEFRSRGPCPVTHH